MGRVAGSYGFDVLVLSVSNHRPHYETVASFRHECTKQAIQVHAGEMPLTLLVAVRMREMNCDCVLKPIVRCNLRPREALFANRLELLPDVFVISAVGRHRTQYMPYEDTDSALVFGAPGQLTPKDDLRSVL